MLHFFKYIISGIGPLWKLSCGREVHSVFIEDKNTCLSPTPKTTPVPYGKGYEDRRLKSTQHFSPEVAFQKRSIRLGCVGSMLALLVSVVSAQAHEETKKTLPEKIKIGVLAPLTGRVAAVGLEIKMGVEQAIKDINEKGGILGRPLVLVTADDLADPREGVVGANKLIGENVKMVVGSLTTAVTVPTSEKFHEHAILQITPASSAPNVTNRGLWNIFRTCGMDQEQGVIAARYLVNHFSTKNILILHDKTAYGKGLADSVKETLNAHHITEKGFEGLNPGEKDYSAIVVKAKSIGADVVYWGGWYTEAALLVRQMREHGMKTLLFAGDALMSNEFPLLAGPEAEGALMTLSPPPGARVSGQMLKKKLEEQNLQPEIYVFYAYAAVEIFKQAAEKAQSLDTKKLAEVMHSGLIFPTVIGPVAFDKDGNSIGEKYIIYEWRKGTTGKISYFPMEE